MPEQKKRQPGYSELMLYWTIDQLRQKVDQSPLIIQRIVDTKLRWVHQAINYISENKVIASSKVIAGEPSGLSKNNDVSSIYQTLQNHFVESKKTLFGLGRSAEQMLIHMAGQSEADDRPLVLKDTLYLLKHDVFPVSMALASSKLLLSAVNTYTDRSDPNYIGFYLIAMVTTVALMTDVVLPYSLRFFAHLVPMNIFYRQKFDLLTKDTRVRDSKCCDDRCTTSRHIKGEVREAAGYYLQLLYFQLSQIFVGVLKCLVSQNSDNQNLGLNVFIGGIETFLFLLNCFHLGQETLKLRYISDGVCSRERFESVNNNIKLVTMLGLLQLGAVEILQRYIVGYNVPTVMLSGLVFLYMTGLVHYINVPAPTVMTAQSAALKVIPTNAVYCIVDDILGRAIENAKDGCYQELKSHIKGSQWSTEAFKKDIIAFRKKYYEEAFYGWFRELIELIDIKPVLLPALQNEDEFLTDPIFKQYWPTVLSQVDDILKIIIEYRYCAVKVLDALSAVKSISSSVQDIPFLRELIACATSFFLGPLHSLLDPKFVLEDVPDGFDSFLGWANRMLSKEEGVEEKVDGEKTLVERGRSAIKKFRQKREVLKKVINGVPVGATELIAHNLNDENFIKELIKIRYLILNMMKTYQVGKYKDDNLLSADDLMELEGVSQSEIFHRQLCDQFEDANHQVIINDLFLYRELIIQEEKDFRSALLENFKDVDENERQQEAMRQAPSCRFVDDDEFDKIDYEEDFQVRVTSMYRSQAVAIGVLFAQRKQIIGDEERDRQVLCKMYEGDDCEFPKDLAIDPDAGFDKVGGPASVQAFAV